MSSEIDLHNTLEIFFIFQWFTCSFETQWLFHYHLVLFALMYRWSIGNFIRFPLFHVDEFVMKMRLESLELRTCKWCARLDFIKKYLLTSFEQIDMSICNLRIEFRLILMILTIRIQPLHLKKILFLFSLVLMQENVYIFLDWDFFTDADEFSGCFMIDTMIFVRIKS